MAAIGAPIEGIPGPMTDAQLIAHCEQLTTELKRREQENDHGQPDQEKCRVLFDVAEATAKALIANNCPGV